MGTPIVSFRPIGRTGNNLWQTAACIGYAKKYGYKWVVPTRRATGDTDPYLLPQFWPNLPFGDFQGQRYNQHDPNDYDYKPIPRFDGGVTLVGFFQSEKFFEGAQDEIRSAFPLKDYPEYRDYVSIHVRRGDYVQYAGSFPPITNKYVSHAFEQFPEDAKYLVFSDDIQWCKDNWRGDWLTFCDEPNEYEALSKMASCGHHIIANSSFSWWAAYLGKNPDRIVVSPHHTKWYGPENGVVTAARARGVEPCKDLIPDNWIQIKI